MDADGLQPLPEPAGPITFGFAGRLLVDKGIRALVAAHGILRSQGHELNLIIAGNPDPANPTSVSRGEVEQWIKRPGITWLGHIDDIVSLWRMCHLAVLPSHREGLPVSLLEAAACGRPLIATDVPGCREIVIENETGLLVPIENPTALAQSIIRLAESPQLRARYGTAARRWWWTNCRRELSESRSWSFTIVSRKTFQENIPRKPRARRKLEKSCWSVSTMRRSPAQHLAI